MCGGKDLRLAEVVPRSNNTARRELELDLVIVVVVRQLPVAALGADSGRPNRPPGGARAQARRRRVKAYRRPADVPRVPCRPNVRSCLRRDSSDYLCVNVCVFVCICVCVYI